ncbi:MAG: polyphosphate:AMP phosphotransferase, partial [Deltaproteobacteria bacterium]|nr:polyphosphate:AMP phosphotransferase [Deltaproteobacteria bacterium]
MFESAELAPTMSKPEYKRRAGKLRQELLELQQDLREADFPVIVLVNGVEGAGKGDTVNLLLEWLDARYVVTEAFGAPTEEEQARPAFWRYWRALPPRGRIGIFFGNWYTAPIVERAFDRIDKNAFGSELERINTFERLLVNEGAVVLKLWFHLSKRAQKRELARLRKDKDTAWRVSKRDVKFSSRYDTFRAVSEAALHATDTGAAPWHIIDAHDRRHREIAVTTLIRDRLKERLGERSQRASKAPLATTAKAAKLNVLSRLDLSERLTEPEYEHALEKWQRRLNLAARELERAGRGAIFAFEGMDAAGKGGAIRRITQALDARHYRVIPIAAPTDEERAQPYLWRFWRHLPRAGRVTIFDRTWYGRVLVERIEGYCAPRDWKRAFNEINDFEDQLTRFGTVLVKYYMVISADEQLRRFRAREKTGYKRYKITEEDWRNRNKAPAYEAAAVEMIGRT